jgi:betaine-aldehyde dehydrogenase
MFINGEMVASLSGKTREIRTPANDQVIALVPESQPEDIDTVVAAARAAFDDGSWRKTTAL